MIQNTHGAGAGRGVPYLFSPAHLAEAWARRARAAACLLRDVKEVTPATLGDLIHAGFPPDGGRTR